MRVSGHALTWPVALAAVLIMGGAWLGAVKNKT
jgi:hypothetical protein